MASRSILVVSYYYPPAPMGGNRWAAMAKYLRRAGHRVAVLTTSAFGSLPDDAEGGIVRVPDLAQSETLRRLARRPPLPRPGREPPDQKPAPALFTRVVVPDTWLISWTP